MYCTVTEYVKRYGERELVQRTDRYGDRPETVRVDVFERASNDASAWIHTYVSGRYTVPFVNTVAQPAPQIIIAIACRETRYLLFEGGVERGDAMQLQHEQDERTLRDIRDGKLKLDIQPEPAVAPVTGIGSAVGFDGGRVFARAQTYVNS
jgi:phage gp36-like protein